MVDKIMNTYLGTLLSNVVTLVLIAVGHCDSI